MRDIGNKMNAQIENIFKQLNNESVLHYNSG